MSETESIGEQIGSAIAIKALREIMITKPDERDKLRLQIVMLERKRPKTIEAFEEREVEIARLRAELLELEIRR